MHEPAWFRWARVVGLTLLGLFALLPVYVMLTSALKPLPDVEGVFRWFFIDDFRDMVSGSFFSPR